MKFRILILSILTLGLTAQGMSVALAATPKNRIEWTIQNQWNLPAEPVSIVQALDNSKVFVLAKDNTVYVFTPDGTLLGSIPVNPDTTAIDIAPRGELLYLAGKNGYTALSLSITQDIDTSGSPFLGKENAPVTLVVFSDFQ